MKINIYWLSGACIRIGFYCFAISAILKRISDENISIWFYAGLWASLILVCTDLVASTINGYLALKK